MKINPIYYSSITLNKKINKPCFKGNISKYSYNSFINCCKKAELNLEGIKKQCIPENIKGTGANSTVYKFSHPELDNWVIKIYNGMLDKINSSSIMYEVEDIFEGYNLGQEIAKIDNSAVILKKVNGIEHSIPNWSKRNSTINTTNPITYNEASDFANSLKTIANFPSESYYKFARELKILNDAGYKSDSFNPNNLLIDYEKQEIHIIDAYKYLVDENRNTKYDLICPILDFTHFGKYWNLLPNKEELVNNAKKIFEKCTVAARQEGISTSEKKYVDYIADVDSRLNLGNLYSNSFQILKQLCDF